MFWEVFRNGLWHWWEKRMPQVRKLLFSFTTIKEMVETVNKYLINSIGNYEIPALIARSVNGKQSLNTWVVLLQENGFHLLES